MSLGATLDAIPSALRRWILIVAMFLIGGLAQDLYSRFIVVETWHTRHAESSKAAFESLGRATNDIHQLFQAQQDEIHRLDSETKVLRDRSDRMETSSADEIDGDPSG